MDDRFDSIYTHCFDKWVTLAHISGWDMWTTGLLDRPKCIISPQIIGDFYELHGFLIAMEYRWPNEHPEIQAAFEDFRLILDNLLTWFFEYFQRSENDALYVLEKVEFQNFKPGATPEHDVQVINHNGVGGDVEDDVIALTKSANHIIDLFNPLFSRLNRKAPAKLVVNYRGGPIGAMGMITPELSDEDREFIYSYWLIADREREIFQKSNRFLQPDYLPLKHRLQRLYSTLTQVQIP